MVFMPFCRITTCNLVYRVLTKASGKVESASAERNAAAIAPRRPLGNMGCSDYPAATTDKKRYFLPKNAMSFGKKAAL